MKKLISLLPIPLLLICLLLAGCTPDPPSPASSAAAFTASTEAPATEAPEPKPVGLVEVTGLEIGEDEGVFGLCCADGLGYIMLQRWDQQAGTSRYRLVTLDPETASVTAEAELDSVPQDAGYDRMKITEGEILLIDEYDERCAVYDRAGTFLGFRDYPVMSREHRGWQNRLLKDDCFWKDTDFASCTDSRGGELSRLVAFYDETDRIHALQEPYENVAAVAGHRVLTRSYGEDSLSYVLWDFDAELRLGEAVLTASQVEGARWVNPWGAAIGEDWVLLGAEWSGEAAVIGPEDPPPARTHRLLFWYPDPEAQRPLEQEIWTEERFNEGIAALKTELEALGLTLRLDEAPAKKADWDPSRKPPVFFRNLGPEERAELIAKDPAYSRIVCRCETVTEGEIRDADPRRHGSLSGRLLRFQSHGDPGGRTRGRDQRDH